MGGMDMGASPSAKSAKATLSPDGSAAGAGAGNVAVVKNQVHVDARVQQLTAASKYTVHLHRGACAASGDVIKTVGDIRPTPPVRGPPTLSTTVPTCRLPRSWMSTRLPPPPQRPFAATSSNTIAPWQGQCCPGRP